MQKTGLGNRKTEDQKALNCTNLEEVYPGSITFLMLIYLITSDTVSIPMNIVKFEPMQNSHFL